MNATQKVWMPAGDDLTEAGRKVLMLQISKTQEVNPRVMPYLMMAKLERLILAAQEQGQDPEEILAESPELAAAVSLAASPRQMAEAIAETDSLGALMRRVNYSKKMPVPIPMAKQYQDQTLQTLVADLEHENANLA